MTPQNNKSWEDGSLTFDELRNIIDVCDVSNVETKIDSLHISFVPKDVTGKAWEELREKMLPTIKK